LVSTIRISGQRLGFHGQETQANRLQELEDRAVRAHAQGEGEDRHGCEPGIEAQDAQAVRRSCPKASTIPTVFMR
jgi:hypothetical protein